MTSRSGWPVRDPEQLPDHDEALILYHLIHQVSDTTRTSDGEVDGRLEKAAFAHDLLEPVFDKA
jgi:hypothetical protein